MLHFRQIGDSRSHSFAYLLADAERGAAVMVDPSEGQTALYLGVLAEIQARLTHVLLTHTHDACAPGALALRDASGARLVCGKRCRFQGANERVTDGSTIAFGDELIHCRATPGHTAGCMSYLWRDRVLTGDALLIGSCGCVELDDGDAGILFDSVTRKLLSLPDETLVYPAHDFAGRRVSCIGEQRGTNPSFSGTTRDEFIAKQYATARHLLAKRPLTRSAIPPFLARSE